MYSFAATYAFLWINGFLHLLFQLGNIRVRTKSYCYLLINAPGAEGLVGI